MPPQPRTTEPATQRGVWAFKVSHPRLNNFLVRYARMTEPLIVLTAILNTGFPFRRVQSSTPLTTTMLTPLTTRWQRSLVWYVAGFSFYSRYVLTVLSIAWMFMKKTRRNGAREEGERENAR